MTIARHVSDSGVIAVTAAVRVPLDVEPLPLNPMRPANSVAMTVPHVPRVAVPSVASAEKRAAALRAVFEFRQFQVSLPISACGSLLQRRTVHNLRDRIVGTLTDAVFDCTQAIVVDAKPRHIISERRSHEVVPTAAAVLFCSVGCV